MRRALLVLLTLICLGRGGQALASEEPCNLKAVHNTYRKIERGGPRPVLVARYERLLSRCEGPPPHKGAAPG